VSTYREDLAAAARHIQARSKRIPGFRWSAVCDEKWSELLRKLNEAEQAGRDEEARQLVAEWKEHAIRQLEPYEKKRRQA
jgi:hypothetical protein